MTKVRPQLLYLVATLSLGLAGCGGEGGKPDQSQAAKEGAGDGATMEAPASQEPRPAASATPNLASGPDVCFRAVVNHLGKDTKVAEITSFFSAGSEIDSSNREPQGQMTTCTVQYQSPDDPRKLVATRLDIASGTFAPPNPVEITVMGNAAEFRLEDHLIALSQINPAALTTVMDAQKARLSGVYSRYAWTGVRLSSPDAFSAKHTLRLDLAGRLAANDIKDTGYASVSTDGTKITSDHLTP